ncbi:uncharacterized protein LOC144342001, partial [Saccoglossus kowalevskii]
GKGLIVNEDTENAVKQRRRALLLHSAGPDVQDIFSTLPLTGEVTDYDAAVTALNTYFVPQVNPAFARQTFHQIAQKQGETVQQFVTRLRKAARDCNFAADNDNQIRDAVLNKCTSDYVRRKLLEEGQGLNLARTLVIADQCEKVEAQMTALSTARGGEVTVNRVMEKPWKKPTCGKRDKGHSKFKDNSDRSCYRCGKVGHYGRDANCPAKGQTCRKCKGRDHFARVCKSKRDKPHVNQIEEVQNDPSNEYAFTILGSDRSNMLVICVGGVSLKMMVDSGATSNIIDEATWETLKSSNIKCKSYAAPQGKKLYTYGSSSSLSVKGSFTCNTSVGDSSVQAEFLVIRGKGIPLLGRQTAMKLGVFKDRH